MDHSVAAASPASFKRPTRRMVFLAGVSVAALASASPQSTYAKSLNGGGSSGALAAPNIASDAATRAAQQAAAAARQTQSSLARAARAVQDMQGVQAAARAAAVARQTSLTAPVAVPNGLGAGGLLPNMPAGWNGANAPTQSVDNAGQTQVGIRQTTQQAILNWQSFNVGARTTLTFDQQGNANWVALNRVNNATAPSQILGNIKADGQVYVINQSGIIFGGGSQIDVGALIASTAGITDAQFRSNGIYSAQNGTTYVPSFTAAGGKVVVEAGAAINTRAPASVTSGGGYVLMIGSEVSNAGAIGTPKGQTILAAGDDFILRPGVGTTANSFSTTRGSEIAPVLNNGSVNGAVSNTGLVFAQQGDITLAGRSIAQSGALVATTSVNTRGTIHLLNAASDSAGSITLGAGSLTTVLPELDSKETALDSQRDALIADSTTQNRLRLQANAAQFDNLSKLADRQDQSRIEIVTGGTVTFKGGSATAAQGGQIVVSANQRIVAETGAALDVSGVRNVALAMSSNNISINVQGNELRDSPQNRDSSVLKNNDVWIDVRSLTLVPTGTGGYASDRYYTAGGLLEVGGYLGTTAHTIGEWAAVGGSITLAAPEVLARKGATFDISGGSLDYAAGWIRSTNLIGSDGRRYSVDNAPAGLDFVAFAGGFSRMHNIQGQVDKRLTETWTSVFDRGRTSLRWEEAYSVGRDAGKLTLSAPTSMFEGDIVADVINGQRQRGARVAGVTDGYKLTQNTVALPGTLALQSYGMLGSVPTILASATQVTFSNAAAPADRAGTSWFNADAISSFGLGGLTVWSTKGITVADALTLAPGGKVDFAAPSIDVHATLTARGGSVSLGSLAGPIGLIDANGAVHIGLHSGATIDTRGLWINALTDPDTDLSRLAFIDGGAVSLKLTGGDNTQTTKSGDVTLDKGSSIDASAGGAILATGKFTGGKGGDITLSTFDWTDGSHQSSLIAATLTLDGTLASYGFSKGGALTIRTGAPVVIGETTVDLSSGQLPAGVAAPYGLTLTQDFVVPAGVPLPADAVKTFPVGTSLVGVPIPVRSANSPIQYNGATIADWANVPYDLTYFVAGQGDFFVPKGGTLPAGRVPAFRFSGLPDSATITIPQGVYASFTVKNSDLSAAYVAGSTVPFNLTLQAGVNIPRGAVLPQTASVQAPLQLDPGLFGSGFSGYAVNGNRGVFVSDGAKVDVTMPIYQLSASA